MGFWGDGPFENDTAVDWLCSFEKWLMVDIEQAIESPTSDKSADEAVAAIELATMLNIKPGYTKYGTCPLGYKFPNSRIIDKSLECLEVLMSNWHKDISNYPSIKTLKDLQDKVKVIRNNLLAEGVVVCNDKQ